MTYKKRFFCFFLALSVLLLGAAPRAQAQEERMSFIRDAEIESTIRTLSAPLFEAVGLEPSAVEIYLVNDNSLNAFVANGQKLFINTGLLMRSENANQVIGVVAHETGHISGGHISRTHDVIARSMATSLLAMLLGGAAIAAGASPDVGTALLLGGQHLSERTFLSYSRTQESSADQAAMTILDKTNQSAKGYLEFLKIIEGQELLVSARQDPYVRTHPVTSDRIEAIGAHIAKSPFSKSKTPEEIETLHRRMKAKLIGFMSSIPHTLRLYPETDNSVESRYARAIAYYRRPDLDKALALMDGLIAEHPQDPYFHEMKGQMLFENARQPAALEAYQKALALSPLSPLIMTQVARIQLEMNNPEMTKAAIVHLKNALQVERTSPFIWRQLGIAYGRLGNIAQSSLALAEEGLLIGDDGAARFHAGRAEKLLKHGSPGWLQAQDIIQELSRRKKKKER
jgi:predicted Zn-dependent protease